MPTLKINESIVHSINLSEQNSAISIDKSLVELNNNSETIKLIGEANKIAFSRSRHHVAVSREQSLCMNEICRAHIDNPNIIDTSARIMDMLAEHLAKSDTTTWGEITALFSDYESHGRRYLLVSLLPKKPELTSITHDVEGILLVKSETIKISEMLTSILVDLTLLESSPWFEIASTMTKCRKASEEEIILNALNLKLDTSIESNTKLFVETITDFLALPSLSITEKKLATNQLNDAIASSKAKPLEVQELTTSLEAIGNGISGKLKDHLENAGFDSHKPIQLDNKVAKTLRRISWSSGGVTLSLSPSALQKNVSFDPESNSITISNLPKHVRESILNILQANG